RTDYDLRNHSEKSGVDLSVTDEAGNKMYPHVIEPSMGVERTFLAVLSAAYREEEKRVVLKLPPVLSPYKAAVFPLLANKPELMNKAREVFFNLKKNFPVAFDERGNIGKRYFAQDEIGTPWCVTVDFQSLTDGTVTVRDRDTMRQERVEISGLIKYFTEKLS
ncbi:MAG: His/Gly/Thr/Pro-type tRNA ligase C-terminal domain-containing protein, partial [Patescibacteria group bacterium]